MKLSEKISEIRERFKLDEKGIREIDGQAAYTVDIQYNYEYVGTAFTFDCDQVNALPALFAKWRFKQGKGAALKSGPLPWAEYNSADQIIGHIIEENFLVADKCQIMDEVVHPPFYPIVKAVKAMHFCGIEKSIDNPDADIFIRCIVTVASHGKEDVDRAAIIDIENDEIMIGGEMAAIANPMNVSAMIKSKICDYYEKQEEQNG